MTIPQGRLRRTAPLAAISARAAGEGVVDSLRRRLKGQRGASLEFHERNAERYADVLSRSKGVLMKVGQMVSFVDAGAVLEGPYGEVYRAALASLQADAEPMEPVLVAAVIESELGHPPEEVFAEFSPEPIAAASIAELRDRWGEAINRLFFGSIARVAMFSADPRPGNYLFHDDGTVTFLDFGCVKRMTPAVQRGFFDFHAAAMDSDAERLLRVWIEHGFARVESPPPADKVLAWCRQNFAAYVQPQPFTFTPEF